MRIDSSGFSFAGPMASSSYHWRVPSLFEFAGGEEAVHRLEDTFYRSVLEDPLLQPLFGAGQPRHVDHLTAFTGESFGGPDRFTRELGFAHLIDVHRHLRITEEQRQRFVELYVAALEASDLPDDEDFREAVLSHVEFRLEGRDAELECQQRWRAPSTARGSSLDLAR